VLLRAARRVLRALDAVALLLELLDELLGVELAAGSHEDAVVAELLVNVQALLDRLLQRLDLPLPRGLPGAEVREQVVALAVEVGDDLVGLHELHRQVLLVPGLGLQ